jgi:hypothetical protein
MLRAQGMKIREIANQFYSTKLAYPERQVLRDYSKAKKLSQNAVNVTFPGKY